MSLEEERKEEKMDIKHKLYNLHLTKQELQYLKVLLEMQDIQEERLEHDSITAKLKNL